MKQWWGVLTVVFLAGSLLWVQAIYLTGQLGLLQTASNNLFKLGERELLRWTPQTSYPDIPDLLFTWGDSGHFMVRDQGVDSVSIVALLDSKLLKIRRLFWDVRSSTVEGVVSHAVDR